ncbi:carbohydrate kinase, thermoresistant glucokinase family [Cellulomonas flavigena DSM 20109]|uniref:Gluconokinase n=1 Tax=Cellulomonas flavigena (strain ATCC 482 / DSM 20109 / BCRC 11376 / JCM 18109 / NBRC 3775 / NCIMB 8073 / NRS 134) TaxID=446466 RepID=D5ULX4_CELFN|nr:gluconokinase [Cellulomonas flavigena]ADG76080.1 carbohydrate kinase, thermoresistant glucokinase family [Cellulomonas flavigena DSM 20109]
MDVEHLVVMGVSGIGKSTVGRELARRLGRPFLEGDDLHPEANVARMSAGVALLDEDREPWLAAVRDAMTEHAGAGTSTVVACSALRRSYRAVLREATGRVRFVLLDVTGDVLRRRVATRTGHWMPPALLDSQLATLEPLAPDEDGVTVPVGGPPDAVAADVLTALT